MALIMEEVVKDQAIKKKIFSFKMPLPRVYKYCSVESLLNILQDSQIFLSHHQYFNDPEESKYIMKVLKKCEKQLGLKFDNSNMRAIYRLMSSYKGECYTACFSFLEDILSQWRAYASAGTGVCIGFDMDKIYDSFSQSFTFNQVLYTEDRQKSMIIEILMRHIPYENFDILKYSDEELKEKMRYSFNHIPDANDEYIVHKIFELSRMKMKEIMNNKEFKFEESRNVVACVKELAQLSHLLKDPSYHEEKEYRLCYFPKIQAYNKKLQDSISIGDLHHRYCDNKIIPYYFLNFANQKDIIREIVFGPKCELDHFAVRSLLKKLGYKNVKISRSKIKYR